MQLQFTVSVLQSVCGWSTYCAYA